MSFWESRIYKAPPPLRRVGKVQNLRESYTQEGKETTIEEEDHQQQQKAFKPDTPSLKKTRKSLKKVKEQVQGPKPIAAPEHGRYEKKTVDELVEKFEHIEQTGTKAKKVHWAPGY